MRALYVENLHYHANDITELRKLAEINPELAAEMVASRKEEVRLMDGSFRLGIWVSAVLALAAIAGFVAIVIFIGWWQSILFLGVLLGASHLLRVVLTGEWSDTSWIGSILGGKKPD